METERGRYPGLSDTPWSPPTPTTQEAGESPAPRTGPPDKAVKAGLERAGTYVKDAVNKAREKMVGYREGGMEQVPHDIVEYAHSRPMTALLIATGVGLVVGMLLTLGRK